ncbi:hypothetical protein DICPUDRAFT_158206 [Dictyostelium purpureum]|uniref:Uncharacterized protein n=1 Tax=Dictyostelium purpureum TaxID=5786 RepID=F1A127_DICPU|nr:uncharacterized protein DICPUDRAFT_158206 [Dictyostelium purpureum]EGC30103.1 hypothetical protein DICPUDRAFT_158206 [Dictyostelium purpureum]|eukprot:XP_003293371.1 hypothetical protein DICPUDRAFT_158206 [Dictyostelium purpureum]
MQTYNQNCQGLELFKRILEYDVAEIFSVLGSAASSKQDFSNQSNNSKKQSNIYLNIELNKFNNRAQYLNTPILVIYI